MHTNKVHTPERWVYVSNSISRYFWKIKPRVIYSVKICRHWSNVLYRISIIFVIRNKTVQNLSFKDSEVEVCSSITPWAARTAWSWHQGDSLTDNLEIISSSC